MQYSGRTAAQSDEAGGIVPHGPWPFRALADQPLPRSSRTTSAIPASLLFRPSLAPFPLPQQTPARYYALMRTRFAHCSILLLLINSARELLNRKQSIYYKSKTKSF